MVVAEALDFPGAVSQGFDLARMLLEEGKPLPLPDPDAFAADADLIELVDSPGGRDSSRAGLQSGNRRH